MDTFVPAGRGEGGHGRRELTSLVRLAGVTTVPLDRSCSRHGFARIVRHLAGGESSYARPRAGQELVIGEARGATIREATVAAARGVAEDLE